MEEYETITLEDGIEYAIIDEIEEFVYLANINDPEDLAIRKNINKEGKDYISSLDNKEEFEKALKLFHDKNNE